MTSPTPGVEEARTPEEAIATLRSALSAISKGFECVNTNHEDFRIQAASIADDALAKTKLFAETPLLDATLPQAPKDGEADLEIVRGYFQRLVEGLNNQNHDSEQRALALYALRNQGGLKLRFSDAWIKEKADAEEGHEVGVGGEPSSSPSQEWPAKVREALDPWTRNGSSLDRATEAILSLIPTPARLPVEVSQAVADIAAERERQQAQEGWDTDHDDEYNVCRLAQAAAVYALNAAGVELEMERRISHYYERYTDDSVPIWGEAPKLWPWLAASWKPKNPRRDLVRAGALIAAEIELLDRADQLAASIGESGPETFAQILKRLEAYYDPAGIHDWLSAEHPQLDGDTALQRIIAGDVQSVVTILDRLDSDAYL